MNAHPSVRLPSAGPCRIRCGGASSMFPGRPGCHVTISRCIRITQALTYRTARQAAARLITPPDRTAMFEIPGAAVDVREMCLPHPPSETRYQVVIESADRNPLPGVEFRLLQSDGPLLGAEFTAIEYVERLVPLLGTRSPVVHEQPTNEPVDPQLLTEFPPTSRGGRLPRLHIPTRQIPAIAIGLVHKQHFVAANEQRPRSQPRSPELRHHPSQPRKTPLGPQRRAEARAADTRPT